MILLRIFLSEIRYLGQRCRLRQPCGMTEEQPTTGWVTRVGSDWWATILGLAITALAVAGVLPRIPW